MEKIKKDFVSEGAYRCKVVSSFNSSQMKDYSSAPFISFEFKTDDIKFFYRGNNLDSKLIILNVTFQGKKGNKSQIQNLQDSFLKEKKESQPNRIKTCGSTFKNPKNEKAWKLIKSSDCSNITVGGASISSKHCNFFVNNGKATSADVEKLIEKVKEKVLLKTGVNLELEIKIVGRKFEK